MPLYTTYYLGGSFSARFGFRFGVGVGSRVGDFGGWYIQRGSGVVAGFRGFWNLSNEGPRPGLSGRSVN